MTLAEISEAWQALRTAILGRSGLDTKASPELRASFQASYAKWLEWYESADAMEHLKGSAGEASRYVDSLREITEQAASEGLKPTVVLPATPLEMLGSVFRKLGWAAGGAAALAGLALVVALRRGK